MSRRILNANQWRTMRRQQNELAGATSHNSPFTTDTNYRPIVNPSQAKQLPAVRSSATPGRVVWTLPNRMFS